MPSSRRHSTGEAPAQDGGSRPQRTHLQDEGQHGDEGAGALREQRQGAHTVHAQRVEARGGDQPGAWKAE